MTGEPDRRSSRGRRGLGAFARFAAMLVAIVLAAVPLFVLVDTAILSSPPSPAELGRLVPVPSSHANEGGFCPAADSATLLLSLHDLNVTNGSVLADLSMCMGSAAAGQIQRQSAGRSSRAPMLTIPTLESVFTLNLAQVAALELQNQAAFRPVGAVTVPIDGSPRMYPLDSYRSAIDVQLLHTDLALTIRILADPGVSSFDWSSAQNSTGSAISYTKGHGVTGLGTFHSIAIAAHRPDKVRLFVLCLVAIPLALITLLALRLNEGTPRSIDGLVGVTAILLAILPIRAVLVPSDIASLTLVDFALATEMALLAAGAVWWYLSPSSAGKSAPELRAEQ